MFNLTISFVALDIYDVPMYVSEGHLVVCMNEWPTVDGKACLPDDIDSWPETDMDFTPSPACAVAFDRKHNASSVRVSERTLVDLLVPNAIADSPQTSDVRQQLASYDQLMPSQEESLMPLSSHDSMHSETEPPLLSPNGGRRYDTKQQTELDTTVRATESVVMPSSRPPPSVFRISDDVMHDTRPLDMQTWSSIEIPQPPSSSHRTRVTHVRTSCDSDHDAMSIDEADVPCASVGGKYANAHGIKGES